MLPLVNQVLFVLELDQYVLEITHIQVKEIFIQTQLSFMLLLIIQKEVFIFDKTLLSITTDI